MLGEEGIVKKLLKRRSSLDTRKYAFSNRIGHKWNALLTIVWIALHLNDFKSKIYIELEPET